VRLHPALSALAATGLLLSLAACDDGDPQASSTPPTVSTMLTPSATPTRPAPPTIPPAARNGLTVTSAEAFARFYISAMDYLVGTGDGSLARQWSEKGCAACKSLIDSYERLYKDGGSVTGDPLTRITSVKEVRLVREDTASVIFRAQEQPLVERSKAGASPTPYPGATFNWVFTLSASSGHWVMFEMERNR
jgi:Family of unknown function (DUF6318)